MPECVLHPACCWHSLAPDLSPGSLEFKSQIAESGMTLKRFKSGRGHREAKFPSQTLSDLVGINDSVEDFPFNQNEMIEWE